MQKTFNNFFTLKTVVKKGLLFMALFGTITMSSGFMAVGPVPAVAVAKASTSSFSFSTSSTSSSSSDGNSTSTSSNSSSTNSGIGTNCAVASALGETVSDHTPTVGETITYSLNGTIAFTDPTTITVTDMLGAGLTFVSATPSVGTYTSSTGIWNIGKQNGSIPGGISLDVVATVNAGTEGQTINSNPTIEYVQTACDQSSAITGVSIRIEKAPIVTPTSTPVNYADLSVTKTANVTSTVEGGTIDYTVAVTDLGPGTSTGVAVTDLLPAGLTFVSATTSGSSYASSTGIWNVGDLSASSTATLNIAATVNTGTAGTTITNTAVAAESASSTDSNMTNNSSSVSIPVAANNTPCVLSPSQFHADLQNGMVTVSGPTANIGSSTASMTVTNHTQCTAPISLASYKMYVQPGQPQWLSTQTLFDVTSTPAIAASSTETFVVALAPCMTQVDGYYGAAPATLLDTNPYSYPNVPFLLGYLTTNAPLCGVTPVADLSVTKTADVTSTVEGGTVNYTVAVTDLGPATSTGVVATDTLPAGLTLVSATTSEGSYASSTGTWTIGNLSASSTATLNIKATVNTGTGGTTITNTAAATESASTTDNNLSNNSSSVSISVAPTLPAQCTAVTSDQILVSDASNLVNGNPAVLIPLPYNSAWTASISGASWIWKSQYIDNPLIDESSTFVKTFNVSGTIASAMLNINADNTYDVIVNGVNIASSTGSVNYTAANEGNYNIASALHNGTNTIEFVVTNIGEANGTQANNPAGLLYHLDVQTNACPPTPVNYADLSVTKTANVTSTVEGGTIDYTVAVTDLGPGTSTGVAVTDLLPAGLTFVSATTSGSSYASSTGIWNVGDLSASSTATLNIAATVNTGTAGTTITNTAVAAESASSTDSNMTNNSSSVSIPVASNGCTVNCGGGGGTTPTSTTADISIVKTIDNSNPAGGATVNFTVTVTDLGPDASTFVDVNDQLPIGLSFVSATSSQGIYNMGTGDWSIGTVSANATATLQVAAVVDPREAGDTITNTATVSQLSSIVDPNLANNSSSVSLTVQSVGCTSNCGGGGGGGGGNSPTAEIGIVKTVDNANPNPGDTIHYTLTVNATGPSASLGVVANDVLPAGVTFVSATSTEGSYVNSTGVWTIGEMPQGTQAVLTITATVNAGTAGEVISNTGTVKESTAVVDQLSGNNSSTATIDVAGGGGGGGGGTTVGVGGGGGGSVLGASTSTGQVLGASCGLYLTQYIHPIRKYLNDPTEVKKLQVFLNMNLGMNLPLDGSYSTADIAAVDQFQTKYHSEVLEPWAAQGLLPTEFTPTDYVYQTTQRWINLIMCPPLNIPLPVLHVDNS